MASRPSTSVQPDDFRGSSSDSLSSSASFAVFGDDYDKKDISGCLLFRAVLIISHPVEEYLHIRGHGEGGAGGGYSPPPPSLTLP